MVVITKESNSRISQTSFKETKEDQFSHKYMFKDNRNIRFIRTWSLLKYTGAVDVLPEFPNNKRALSTVKTSSTIFSKNMRLTKYYAIMSNLLFLVDKPLVLACWLYREWHHGDLWSSRLVLVLGKYLDCKLCMYQGLVSRK